MLGRVAILTLAQGIAALGSALGLILFSQLMSPAEFGRGMLLVALGTTGSLLASLNLEAVSVHALQGKSARAYLRLLVAVVVVMGSFGAGIALAGAGMGGLTRVEGILLAALVPAVAVVRIMARCGTSLGYPLAGALPRLLARPIAFGGGALALWLCGRAASETTLPALLLASMLAAALVQAGVLQRRFRTVQPGENARVRPWLLTGIALAPGLLLLDYHRHLILIAAAPGLDPAALGHLSLALSIAAMPALPIIAVEMALTGPMARCLADGNDAGVRRLLKQGAVLRLMGLVLALGSLGILLGLGASVLPTLAEAGPLVWWLCLPAMARAALGNPLLGLTLAGRTGGIAPILCIGLVVNLVLIAIGAASGGGSGAAFGAGLGFWLVWGVLWRRCQALAGLDTSVLALLRGRAVPTGIGVAQRPVGQGAVR